MTDHIKVSIVIPTFQRREIISQTLPTALAQTFNRAEYEIIVVVDGSTDGTAECLRGAYSTSSVRVVEQPNRGPAAARNVGIKAARGEVILFLDDDVMCDPRLIEEHAAAHAGEDRVVVMGSVRLTRPSTVVGEWTRRFNERVHGRWQTARNLQPWKDVWIAQNCSVSRAALVEQQGFDETFQKVSYEDAELAIRLSLAGVHFKYAPRAIAHALIVKSTRDVLNDAVTAGICEARLCRRYRSFCGHGPIAQSHQSSGAVKRILMKAAIASPGWTEALQPIITVAEQLQSLRLARAIGSRALGARFATLRLRSAIAEAGSSARVKAEFCAQLPILAYHRVAPSLPQGAASLTVSTKQFERQISWLMRHGYKTILPSEWHAWLENGTRLPEKPVMLTFDDGYEEVVHYALPLLERHGLKATVFVVTGLIGHTNKWDEDRGMPSLNLMTHDQIGYWAARGMEFGSHSRTHRDLTQIEETELDAEVMESKAVLERITQTPVMSFAYPYGAQNQLVRCCVGKQYRLAFSCFRGLNRLLTDRYLLRRTPVTNRDLPKRMRLLCRSGLRPADYVRRFCPVTIGNSSMEVPIVQP